MSAAGMPFIEDDTAHALSDYSDSLCAQWLALPNCDQDLPEILIATERSRSSCDLNVQRRPILI